MDFRESGDLLDVRLYPARLSGEIPQQEKREKYFLNRKQARAVSSTQQWVQIALICLKASSYLTRTIDSHMNSPSGLLLSPNWYSEVNTSIPHCIFFYKVNVIE